jgi:hypothetical protein
MHPHEKLSLIRKYFSIGTIGPRQPHSPLSTVEWSVASNREAVQHRFWNHTAKKKFKSTHLVVSTSCIQDTVIDTYILVGCRWLLAVSGTSIACGKFVSYDAGCHNYCTIIMLSFYKTLSEQRLCAASHRLRICEGTNFLENYNS